MAILSFNCPNCGTTLSYDENTPSVKCPVCRQRVNATASASAPSRVGGISGGFGISASSSMAMFGGFDNPESGIVFIENYFDTLDWTEYKDSPLIEMGDFTEILNNNKMKNGANGATWYLDFKGLAIPLSKKFEGLQEKLAEISEKYDPEDVAAAYAPFDLYRKISVSLNGQKDALLKRLETAIDYAAKFKLDAAKVTEMKNDLAALTKSFDGIKLYEEIKEVPEYQKAAKVFNDKKKAELAEQGIDAEGEYEAAVAQFNDGNPNKAVALVRFERIRGYADSVEYIHKINKYYAFEKMYHFFGKYYVINKETEKNEEGSFDVKKGCMSKGKSKSTAKADSTAEEVDVLAAELCEVVNGVPAEAALVGGVQDVLAIYNNKIFYVKKNKGLYSYDVYTHEDKLLDEGRTEDFYFDGSIQIELVCNGRGLIVKRNMHPEEKKEASGCSAKKQKEATPAEEIRLNNYCLLYIDMMTGSIKTIIPEMVDVIGHFGDKIFFSHAHKETKTVDAEKKGCLGGGVKTEMVPVTAMKLCDLATGIIKDVLSESCELYEVCGNKVIYAYWKPNGYNKDLRVYDLQSGEDILIEDNIYTYDRVIKDNIYYTVGNESYGSLIRNNFEGTARKEVLQDKVKIIGDKAGWLYVIVGYGRNQALWKIHSDDSENQILLCSQFSNIKKLTATHVYYTDTFNTLRVVRTDGKENVEIGENISWLVVEDNCLYYARREVTAQETVVSVFGTDSSTKSVEGLSLYKMDKDGHNVKKLVFNVDNAYDYDENALYYIKKETLQYEVSVPNEKGDYDKHNESYGVERYFRFDKKTEKSELVLTLGLPNAKTEIKGGCMKKKHDGEIIFTEISAKPQYKPRGLTPIGAVAKKQEETVQQQEEAAKPQGCMNAQKGDNNASAEQQDNANQPAGCLSSIGKKK